MGQRRRKRKAKRSRRSATRRYDEGPTLTWVRLFASLVQIVATAWKHWHG